MKKIKALYQLLTNKRFFLVTIKDKVARYSKDMGDYNIYLTLYTELHELSKKGVHLQFQSLEELKSILTTSIASEKYELCNLVKKELKRRKNNK